MNEEPLLQFFQCEHLPDSLKKIAGDMRDTALLIVTECPRNPERTVALRKLLEAKDCAVRSLLFEG